MSKFKINILFLTFIFYLISGFSFHATAQNEWGNNEDWGNEKKKGLFKKKPKTDENGQPIKVPFFKRIFKGKKGIKDPIADAKKEKNTNFQIVESEYFDGKKLNKKEQKKIAKQVRKYNKQKPSKWEQNYLEMRKRGYPVHPDTARKYRNLAAKVQRQKDARTRKMNKVYRKSLYSVQEKRSDGRSVGDIMKAKHKETTKKHKQKARRLKRRQRTGYYLPFYQRWYESFSEKQKKKKNKKNRQKKDK